MPVFDNLNMTTSPGVAPSVIQYYERTLLRDAPPEMVHNRDAQRRTLPMNNGKRVVFRRFTPFGAITTPLAEGVTPKGQTLHETAFTAMVKPYGGHVELTDEMNFYMLDNMHRETATLLSDQAALSLDTISRNALNAGMNVQYAGSNTTRGTITAADRLTGAEIKKCVRTLKRHNVKPFPDGFYHAIVHPDTVYDLTSDPMWVDIAKYQDKQKIERYELGCMYKVKFFESTNAMVFKPQSYIYGTTAAITASASFDAEKTEIPDVSGLASKSDIPDVSSKVESSEFIQKANEISAIFKSIGLDGGQTGITNIGPHGLTVSHSDIAYTTSMAADGMKIKDSSGNVVGGVYAVNGAVKAAMQSLFNPQNPNFEVTVKSQNEGETNGLHFRIGGINAGSLVAGINSGGETSLVITSGNYLALSCNGTLRIGNAKNYIELSPYGEGKIVFTGRYGGLCTILFQELYDLIPND